MPHACLCNDFEFATEFGSQVLRVRKKQLGRIELYCGNRQRATVISVIVSHSTGEDGQESRNRDRLYRFARRLYQTTTSIVFIIFSLGDQHSEHFETE